MAPDLSSNESLRNGIFAPISKAMLKIIAVFVSVLLVGGVAFAKPATLLALGDSLTAGYGIEANEAFPVKLEAALKAKYPDLHILNGGVSGDTAADGLARLDWALTSDVTGLIVELGANDALRGLDVAQTEAALEGILSRAKTKNLPVLILGMKAPPNLGADYVAAFDGLYPRLAEKYQALLYPFYLDGVAADPALNQADGIHPNAKGVDIIVSKLTAKVEELLTK
jgi:acyl-CoA thioesterase I